ncbi:hypothetical protein, partial [Vibrio parahaemolyticus]|uniref:hypothetical protein n=1 Tax=Vibrio parahaemolyticus TaxID=670 RepID=UPI001C60A669
MEPSVSSVPSSVWAYLKRKLEKVLFLQAYQISHESYLKHKHRKWYEHLVQGIEYDVYLENSRLSN